MENLVLLILFTYPGAIFDWVYTLLAKDKSFYHSMAEHQRVARGFFISSIIALATMPIVIPSSFENYTLKNWVDVLIKTNRIWLYILSSVVISIILGIVWYHTMNKFIFPWQNRRAQKQGLPMSGQYKKVWYEIMHAPDDISLESVVAIIRDNNGNQLNAGLIHCFPDDITEEPQLSLMYCDRVANELAKPPEESLIDGHIITYHNLTHHITIEFRNASRLYEVLKHKEAS